MKADSSPKTCGAPLTNLTVTLGLRYEKQFAFQNTDGTYSAVSYPEYLGRFGRRKSVQTRHADGNFADLTINSVPLTPTRSPPCRLHPSAWLIPVPGHEGFLGTLFGHRTGSSVFRAGYAISTVREGMNVFTGTYGQNQGLNFSASWTPRITRTISERPEAYSSAIRRCRVRSRVANFAAISPQPAFTNSLYAIDPNLKMGYVQSWNLSFQREINKDTVLELHYTGNHGSDRSGAILNLNETNIV